MGAVRNVNYEIGNCLSSKETGGTEWTLCESNHVGFVENQILRSSSTCEGGRRLDG